MEPLMGVALAKQMIKGLAGNDSEIEVEKVLAVLREVESKEDPLPPNDSEIRRIREEGLVNLQRIDAEEVMQRRLASLGHKYSRDLIIAQTNSDSIRDNFKVVIDMGQSSMRSLLLLNGGTTVALLAFMGSLASNDRLISSLPVLIVAASASALGTLLSVLSFGFARLSQEQAYIMHMGHLHDQEEDAEVRGLFRRYRSLNFVSMYVAVVLFIVSVMIGITAFS
jgi:hypothetical protein